MDIRILSKPDCIFCMRAKNYLSSLRLPFSEEMLDEDFTTEYVKLTFPGARTYPIVVVDGWYIGGLTELQAYIRENSSSQKLLLESQLKLLEE